MRSNKRYSNQTFTKRVDHEGGAKRGTRTPAGQKVCSECGAAYIGRRWLSNEDAIASGKFKAAVATTIICPACKQIKEGIAGGYLDLSGGFLEKHREDIRSLLQNEEARAIEDNPLSRIIKWIENGKTSAKIETTTEHLAQRFGHALKKAFDGEVNYDFSHENKVARVSWHRD